MSNSKNPFEIRLEVLKMAQDMVSNQWQDSQNLAWDMVNQIAEYQGKTITDLKDHYDALKPVMYTPQDVVKKANELYEFVCCKKD